MEQPAVRNFRDHEGHGWQKAEVRKSCQEGWAAEARNYDYGSIECSSVWGTTRRLFGAIRKKWDAQWREAAGARCGFANTLRRGTGRGSGRIEAG
jgi:hypothetical protein